jgi:hypothetical protein
LSNGITGRRPDQDQIGTGSDIVEFTARLGELEARIEALGAAVRTLSTGNQWP